LVPVLAGSPPHSFGAMDRVHTVVTDRGLAPEYVEWLQKSRIDVIFADES
jgi:DeoR/GlpR family transcriptional regulator of sugar metabolism